MPERMDARTKLIAKVGRNEYDLTASLPDTRGLNLDELKRSIEEVQVEHRLKSIVKFKLYPYAEAQDIAEWDRGVILETYPPLYLEPEAVCQDCPYGPCNLEKGKAQCGLGFEAYQAKQSLKAVCRGCLSQMTASRQIVSYAIKVFGKEAAVSMGPEQDITDATWVGIMCGFYPENLEQMDRALAYAERELDKAQVASMQGNGSVADFEELAMHAATMLFVAQEVAEFVKIALFGFTSAMKVNLQEVAWYPPGFWSGLALLDKDKPAIAFTGDNFISAWLVVDELKKRDLTGQVQVIGIGAAGDDIARFYDRVIPVGTMYRARKVLRLGLASVVVANECCIPVDFLAETERTGSRLIWSGSREIPGLKDRTEDSVDDIVKDLVGQPGGAWVRDPEKAALVAIELVQKVKREGKYVLSEEEVKKEAGRCRGEDCDLCSYACPNNLEISRAVRRAAQEGLTALYDVEGSCVTCGKCQAACPERIPIEDLVVAAYSAKVPQDKFLMRGGRGPATRSEVASYGFTFFPGNSPGMFGIIGCADCNPDDVGWMAERLASANAIVTISGCVASDVAHVFDPKLEQFIYRKYPFWHHPRSVANLGGCTACQYNPWVVFKYSRTGTGIPWSANYAETMDEMYFILNMPVVIWGAPTERMYAMATAYARTGCNVVVGPVNTARWKRLYSQNKWDWEKYWRYDALKHIKRTVEPSPKQLIVPVETKEEAVAHLMSDQMKTMQPFIMRMLPNEFYFNWHREFFGELPDDWPKYVRTFTDMPGTMRFELMEYLRDIYGWTVHGLWVSEIPHPDGNRYDQQEFLEKYAKACDSYTMLPRLFIRPRRKRVA